MRLLFPLLCLGFYACTPATPPATEHPDHRTEAEKRQPDQAQLSLDVADGLAVTLFAAEPLLVNPTNMDIDARGRVWVCEGRNYRLWNNPRYTEQAEGDRILILEDTDGDGQADTRTVFYQGTDVDAALGIVVLGNQVIVSASPNVLRLTDTDGDDRADKKEILFTGIDGVQHDHGVHAFTFGPDGRLYFNFGNEGKQLRHPGPDSALVIDRWNHPVSEAEGPFRQGMVFRMNPDGTDLEVLGHNFRNNYEVAVDAFGTLWQSDNDDDGNLATRINFVMEYGNYGFQDEMTGDHWWIPRTGMHPEIPKQHWHLNDPGVVPNLLQTGAGSPTGILVYEGTLLPEVYHNQMIHSDAGPNVVRAYPVSPEGAGYSARSLNVVHSPRDPWFRPSDVTAAPDGSLFIADWYDPGVGGHQVEDLERGRIFRVAPPDTPYRIQAPDLSTPEAAVQALVNPNGATRYLAWARLQAWGQQAEPALQSLWAAENPRHRARALWLLARIEGRSAHYIDAALQDPNPDLRITGLRVARQLNLNVAGYIAQLVDDPSPHVRRACAIALRNLPTPEAVPLWTKLAAHYDGQDRWYLEALGIGAAPHWDAAFAAWQADVGEHWTTPAGRNLVWRARTPRALPLLTQLIARPDTDAQTRRRYFRALDFHTTPAKQAALVNLLNGTHPEQPDINGLALKHLTDPTLKQSAQVQAALQQTLDHVAGTQLFVDLARAYGIGNRNPDLLALAMAWPDSSLGIDAANLLLHADGAEGFRPALAGADTLQRNAALRVLGNTMSTPGRDYLFSVVADSTLPRPARRTALAQLSRGEWGGKFYLLDKVKAGQLPPGFESDAARLMQEAYLQNTRDEAAKYLPMPKAPDGAPLLPISQLVQHTGDPASGKAVFERLCSTCHQVNGLGINFGPGLSVIADKLPKEALYSAILYPDAGIGFGYEGYTISRQDGTQATGYILSENETALILRVPGGQTLTIPQADIREKTPLDASLMPALQSTLQVQELVDLVTYLQTLKGPSTTTP